MPVRMMRAEFKNVGASENGNKGNLSVRHWRIEGSDNEYDK
jgi:hypothetical protein